MDKWWNHANNDESINLDGLRFAFLLLSSSSLNLSALLSVFCFLFHPSILSVDQPKHILFYSYEWRWQWTSACFILMNDDEMNEWINDENMRTMMKIQMDKWWNHANNDHKLIHLDGRNMDWLTFKLIDSTHCQIDFLAFSFFSTWKSSQSWSIYCCIPFPFLSLFLFLVFLCSPPPSLLHTFVK